MDPDKIQAEIFRCTTRLMVALGYVVSSVVFMVMLVAMAPDGHTRSLALVAFGLTVVCYFAQIDTHKHPIWRGLVAPVCAGLSWILGFAALMLVMLRGA